MRSRPLLQATPLEIRTYPRRGLRVNEGGTKGERLRAELRNLVLDGGARAIVDGTLEAFGAG